MPRSHTSKPCLGSPLLVFKYSEAASHADHSSQARTRSAPEKGRANSCHLSGRSWPRLPLGSCGRPLSGLFTGSLAPHCLSDKHVLQGPTSRCTPVPFARQQTGTPRSRVPSRGDARRFPASSLAVPLGVTMGNVLNCINSSPVLPPFQRLMCEHNLPGCYISDSLSLAIEPVLVRNKPV